jgi:hypothetical protein
MGWVDCEVKDRYDATWGIQSIPNYTEIRNGMFLFSLCVLCEFDSMLLKSVSKNLPKQICCLFFCLDSVSKLTKQTIEYLIPLLNTLESTKTLWGMHCIGKKQQNQSLFSLTLTNVRIQKKSTTHPNSLFFFHLFSSVLSLSFSKKGDLNSQGRCKLIGQSFIEYLQRKRRHIFRLMQKSTSKVMKIELHLHFRL